MISGETIQGYFLQLLDFFQTGMSFLDFPDISGRHNDKPFIDQSIPKHFIYLSSYIKNLNQAMSTELYRTDFLNRIIELNRT